MKRKHRSGRRTEFPAGTKLHRKALKSQFGTKGYREYFKAKPVHARV